MEQINRIEIQGNVGICRVMDVKDNQVLHFSLATNYAYKSKDGDVIETTWHNVVAWKSKYMPDFNLITKGTALNVVGRMRVSKYIAADGTEKQVHEVLANKITIIHDSI